MTTSGNAMNETDLREREAILSLWLKKPNGNDFVNTMLKSPTRAAARIDISNLKLNDPISYQWRDDNNIIWFEKLPGLLAWEATDRELEIQDEVNRRYPDGYRIF